MKSQTRIIKVAKQTAGTSNLKWDLRYKAMLPGKRRSKRDKIYYEYRINRSDKNPKLRV